VKCIRCLNPITGLNPGADSGFYSFKVAKIRSSYYVEVCRNWRLWSWRVRSWASHVWLMQPVAHTNLWVFLQSAREPWKYLEILCIRNTRLHLLPAGWAKVGRRWFSGLGWSDGDVIIAVLPGTSIYNGDKSWIAIHLATWQSRYVTITRRHWGWETFDSSQELILSRGRKLWSKYFFSYDIWTFSGPEVGANRLLGRSGDHPNVPWKMDSVGVRVLKL